MATPINKVIALSKRGNLTASQREALDNILLGMAPVDELDEKFGDGTLEEYIIGEHPQEDEVRTFLLRKMEETGASSLEMLLARYLKTMVDEAEFATSEEAKLRANKLSEAASDFTDNPKVKGVVEAIVKSAGNQEGKAALQEYLEGFVKDFGSLVNSTEVIKIFTAERLESEIMKDGPKGKGVRN